MDEALADSAPDRSNRARTRPGQGRMVGDGTAAATGTSTSPSSGTIQTSGSPALIYGVTVDNSGTAGHTAGSNLTELAELHAGTRRLVVDERIVSTTGAYGDSGTLTSSVIWTDSVTGHK